VDERRTDFRFDLGDLVERELRSRARFAPSFFRIIILEMILDRSAIVL
jgi:hypothetical protein